ncbi:MAG TPA: patatin-like phospholipase family protein, partial [Bacteroidota bacterium]
MKRPNVALVLSGGGSRGVAAIGVIQALEQAEIPVDYIVGTSMGSIIGGLYAAGYTTKQLQQMADTTHWNELLSFSDEARRRDLFYDQKLAEDRSILVVRFKGLEPIIPSSYSTGQTFLNYLNLLTLQGIYHPNPSFDNLRIPFRAITTDLVSGERVVIDGGDLSEAMRASMTVPLLFSPVAKDTMLLVDGGLASNIPVDVARQLGADIVVVVDATSPLRPADKLNAVWEIADQIMGVVMKRKKEEELAKADIVIRPELAGHLSTDFSRLDWIIEQGFLAAQGQLSALRELLHQRSHAFLTPSVSNAKYPYPRIDFNRQLLGNEWSEKVLEFRLQPNISEQDAKLFVNDCYESGEFERVEFEVHAYRDSTLLLLNVAPFPPLTSVEIVGNNVVSPDTLMEIVKPLIRSRLNVHQIQAAFESLLGAYRDRGLSLARIRDASFNRATGQALVVIDEGIVYRRDIRGTTKTQDYIIWRELPWEQGEVFDVSKVARGIENLYGTNLFEFVSIDVQYEGPQQELNIITIHVRERSTELIRVGMRLDNERNLQPSLDIRDENLLGIGLELGARVYGGPRNRGFVGEFKASRIFDTYLTFNLKGYYEYDDVHVYEDEPLANLERWNRVRVGEYRELRSGGSFAFGAQ